MDCLDILFSPGDVIELRALGKTKNVVQAGYFKDFKKLAEVLNILDKTGEHKGIYVVLNNINPALYARSPDKISQPRESISTTSDADITHRRWLPIDFDPVRPADISASDEEHKLALDRARDVRDSMSAMGWPDPILADSGNGAHLLYKIDLPNDQDSSTMIEYVLKALAGLFSDDRVKIDTKNYNASRIWKAYGTMARKGADVQDRHWRRSEILEAPGEIREVPIELLASLEWEYRQKEADERTPAKKKDYDGKIDIEQWLSSHGLDIAKSKTAHNGGKMLILDQCPWNSDHNDRSAWVVQYDSGAIAAGCHHDGCSGKGWRDLWLLFEKPISPSDRIPIEYATEDEPKPAEGEPGFKYIDQSSPSGSIGLDKDGFVSMIKNVPQKDGTFKSVMQWVSDCAMFIHTETSGPDGTSFVFRGIGAIDHRKVEFCVNAKQVDDSKVFRGIVHTHFGAANKIGKLIFETVQDMSKDTIKKQTLTAPTWIKGKPIIPGVDLLDNINFELSPMVPAFVQNGDFEAAKKTLTEAAKMPDGALLGLVAVLGSPVYAKWFLNDRFGLAYWGGSGSMKTTISQILMTIYGLGYLEDAYLLKHGKAGSTAVGEMEVLASAGFLPCIVDNVKAVDPRDHQQYIAMVHAVMEGVDKIRGNKDGGIRNSKKFSTTLLVTGEIKPSEASTTARVLNIDWVEPKDKTMISYVQAHISDMPVIGYHWLRYLATLDYDPHYGFEEARNRKSAEFNQKKYVNAGRLATIYSLLRMTWKLLCESPIKDAFTGQSDRFLAILDEACDEQGRMVSEETEVAKFIKGIEALIASQPEIIQAGETQAPEEQYRSRQLIGRWIKDDLFLLPELALAALKRLGVFSQIPSENSITKALAQGNYLKCDGKRPKYATKMNGRSVRGWRLIGEKIARAPIGAITTLPGVDEIDNS